MDIRGRHLVLLIAAIAVIAVLIRPELLSDTLMLVFLGIVPHSNIVLPIWVTPLGLVTALLVAIFWPVDHPYYRPVATTHDRARRADARKRVLKKTASQQRTRTTQHRKKQAVRA